MKEFHQCLVRLLREFCFADISLAADVLDQENFYGNDSHYTFHRCDEAQEPRRDADTHGPMMSC
jgi:hypothetical protein